MPRRSRKNWPLWISLSVFFLVLTLFIAWPLLVKSLSRPVGLFLQLTPADQARERAMTALAGLWFFFFGATIGSFLNVVAYRMPKGLTIVSKPSHCPYCMTPISFKHNVPIIGWLVLRGRCNTCRLPISRRYPLVEMSVGVIFYTLFRAELASGGANLPIRTPNSRPGVTWNLFTPQWDLIGIYCFHAFLLGAVVAIALIKLDRLRIPTKLFIFTTMVGLGCQLVWPDLTVVSATAGRLQLPDPLPWIVDPLIGLIGGALVGAVCQGLIGKQTDDSSYVRSRRGSIAIYLLVGLYLGWQAIVPTLLIASLLQLLSTVVGRITLKPVDQYWATSCLVGTWLMLCFWRQLAQIWLPSAESSPASHAIWLAFGFAMVFVVRSIAIDNDWSSQPDLAQSQ